VKPWGSLREKLEKSRRLPDVGQKSPNSRPSAGLRENRTESAQFERSNTSRTAQPDRNFLFRKKSLRPILEYSCRFPVKIAEIVDTLARSFLSFHLRRDALETDGGQLMSFRLDHTKMTCYQSVQIVAGSAGINTGTPMQHGLILRWIVGLMSVSFAEGAEPLWRLSRHLDLRPLRTPEEDSFESRFFRNGDWFSRRASPRFGLQLAVATGEQMVQVASSSPDDDEQDRDDGNNGAGSSKLQDLEVFDHEPGENDLPPLSSVSSSITRESVPLDGAPRDDGQNKAEVKRTPATNRASFAWIAGTQDRLGMLELEFEPLRRVRFDPTPQINFHFDTSFGAKWLQGPVSTDLPPQLVNILINVGVTHQLNDRLTIDAMISPGWYTDFSNKTEDAFRLPWHVVSYSKANDDWKWVLGVTDLARRDIRLLPVIGAIFAPGTGDVRWDLVFPKPRLAWRCSQTDKDADWIYVGGELGGGSWAISRADRQFDIVTYRDFRLVVGSEHQTTNGHASRFEVGWIFGRSVEYRSNDGNYTPPDSLMIRVSSDY
jgi:hypothetical protein